MKASGAITRAYKFPRKPGAKNSARFRRLRAKRHAPRAAITSHSRFKIAAEFVQFRCSLSASVLLLFSHSRSQENKVVLTPNFLFSLLFVVLCFPVPSLRLPQHRDKVVFAAENLRVKHGILNCEFQNIVVLAPENLCAMQIPGFSRFPLFI